MKYTSSLVLALSMAFVAHASPELERIKQSEPEAYSQAQSDCEAWAENDQVISSDLKGYMETCISDAIGYLDDSFEEDSASDQESATDQDDMVDLDEAEYEESQETEYEDQEVANTSAE